MGFGLNKCATKVRKIVDTISKERRSKVMGRVKNKDTKPEFVVRRLVHKMGYRYRLHVKSLAGCPDLVFASRKKIIFVHGCMWHGHEGCANNRRPNSRQDYWTPKLNGNMLRDADNMVKLTLLGWDVMIIWECETKHLDKLGEKIAGFLEKK